MAPVKPAFLYALVEYRMGTNGLGPFASREDADAYKATLPTEGKGWHVIGLERPRAEPGALLRAIRDRDPEYSSEPVIDRDFILDPPEGAVIIDPEPEAD